MCAQLWGWASLPVVTFCEVKKIPPLNLHFFDSIKPSQVVTALWSLHPQDFMQINRILRFCSSPVLIGVTDISHQIMVSVFLEKERKNNLNFPEEKARKRTESCQQENLWDFWGGF